MNLDTLLIVLALVTAVVATLQAGGLLTVGANAVVLLGIAVLLVALALLV